MVNLKIKKRKKRFYRTNVVYSLEETKQAPKTTKKQEKQSKHSTYIYTGYHILYMSLNNTVQAGGVGTQIRKQTKNKTLVTERQTTKKTKKVTNRWQRDRAVETKLVPQKTTKNLFGLMNNQNTAHIYIYIYIYVTTAPLAVIE